MEATAEVETRHKVKARGERGLTEGLATPDQRTPPEPGSVSVAPHPPPNQSLRAKI